MSVSSSTTRHLRGVVVGGLVAAPFVAAPLLPTATAAAPPTCDGLRATIVGTEGRDRIIGTTGRDVIVALGGNDYIDGRGGSDVICAGGGADRVYGGTGNDRLFGGPDRYVGGRSDFYVGDAITPGPGNDLVVPNPPGVNARDVESADLVRFDRAERGVTVDLGAGTATGEGTDTIRAMRVRVLLTDFDDELVAGRHAVEVRAGDGDDVVVGSPEGDVVRPDSPHAPGDEYGDDIVRTGAGDDAVWAEGGTDRLEAGAGNDVVRSTSRTPGQIRLGTGIDDVQLPGVASAGGVDVGASSEERDFVDLGLLTPGTSPWTLDLTTGVLVGPDGAVGSLPPFAAGLNVVDTRAPVEVTGTWRRDRLFVAGEVDQPVRFDAGGRTDLFSGGAGSDTFLGGPGEDIYTADYSPQLRSNTCESVEEDPAGACALP